MGEEFDARIRQALRQRAEQVGRPDDVFGEIRRRSARRRRRQHLAVSVAAVVVLAVPAMTALPRLFQEGEYQVAFAAGERLEVEAPPPGQTVEVPPRGQAWGATFDNGTPVLVVHDARGEVRVFDARSPVSDDGRRGQLGWCRGQMGSRLLDPVTDRRWASDGSPVTVRESSVGASSERHPAASPEQLYAYEVRGDTDDRTVEVGEPRRLEAQTIERPAQAGDEGPPCSPGEVVSPPPPGEFADVMELRELPDGAYRVTAALEQVGDDPARLCPIPEDPNHLRALLRPPRPDLQLPLCGDKTIAVSGSEVARLPDDPHLAHVRVGEFSVSVEDGAVDTLLVPASNMRPRSVPVDGEVVLAGSIQWGAAATGGLSSGRPSDSAVQGTGLDDVDCPGGGPVRLKPPLVDTPAGDGQGFWVSLTTKEVVRGPDWFPEESQCPLDRREPDFWLPLASDADIAVDGESFDHDEFESRVEKGDLEGHEVTVTVDRASGRVVEVRSRDG